MKLGVLFLLGMSSLYAAERQLIEITSLQAPQAERLFFRDGEFMVQKMGRTSPLPADALSRDVHSLGALDVATVVSLQRLGKFELQRAHSADVYRLDYSPSLEGSGALGATVGVAVGGAISALAAWFGGKALKKTVEMATGSEDAGEAAVLVVGTVATTTGMGPTLSYKIMMGCGLFFAIAIPF